MMRIINESLGDGVLYHSTFIEAFTSIVRDGGKLKGFKAGHQWADDKRSKISNKNVISFTRNKNFLFGPIRLKFNRAKIGGKYKVVPYNEYYFDKSADTPKSERESQEEVGIINELDIYKYADEIDLVPSKRSDGYQKISKYLQDGIFNDLAKRRHISLTSTDVECALYMLYIVQTGMIKAGPNLTKMISKLPKDAYKIVDIYPFKSTALPKLSAKSQQIYNEIEELKSIMNNTLSDQSISDNDRYDKIDLIMPKLSKLQKEFKDSLMQ